VEPLTMRPTRLPPATRRAQSGVVLFIALIVMVALSLAGVALVRSIDTTASVTGNIAFRQAALLQANQAVEDAIGHIYAGDTALSASDMIDTKDNDVANCYYAVYDVTGAMPDSTKTDQPGLPAGIPQVLWKKSTASGLDANCRLVDTKDTGSVKNTVSYIIQRMCSIDLTLPAEANQRYCELMEPKQALGTTTGDDAIKVGKFPLYRVTVRVDGPNNSLAFVQAMIRG
jgi:Tfp pilus assembly protein PilX